MTRQRAAREVFRRVALEAEMLSDLSHKAAIASADSCATEKAPSEPERSECCGASAFLFGHVHLIPDPLVVIDNVVTISGGSKIVHGRWGPHIHANDCPLVLAQTRKR
jgi:hypothetical protein